MLRCELFVKHEMCRAFLHHLKTDAGYGPHITVINHDADSASQKGSSGSLGQAGTSSAGTFLGPPGRISMITGAPSPNQVGGFAE